MKTVFITIGLLIATFGYSQTPDASSAMTFTWETNTILLLFAVFMLIPLWAVSRSFTAVMRHYLNEKSKGILTIIVLAGLVLSGESVRAQVPEASNRIEWWSSTLTTSALVLVILFEMWLILFFTSKVNQMLRPEKTATEAGHVTSWWSQVMKVWNRMNFRPIEEEASLDTGHSYDGIRELNNVTPPWFTTAFLLSIVFAFVYMYRYHVAKSAPMMIEEYEISVKKAELLHEEYLKKQANNIDENSVVVMTGHDIEAGKSTFLTLCAVCHRPDGGGQVGPNLTDDYWIHGGSLKQIFSTIKYGVPDKGMISWKSQLSPQQIAQVSNYILLLHGTNPADPKEKQGELYIPEPSFGQDTLGPDTSGSAQALPVEQTNGVR